MSGRHHYSEEEIAIITEMRASGATIGAIAARLGRSPGAIAQKVRYSGIRRAATKRLGKLVITRIDERLFNQWLKLIERRRTTSYALMQTMIEREITSDHHSYT